MDKVVASMEGVASAMRAHVPREAWDQVVQIHWGGAVLQETFGWQTDFFANLLRVTHEGQVVARHDVGPFSVGALAVFLG